MTASPLAFSSLDISILIMMESSSSDIINAQLYRHPRLSDLSIQQKHHTIRGIYIVQLNFAQPRCRSFRRRTITELAKNMPPREFKRPARRRLLLGWGSSSWVIEPARKRMVPMARQPYLMNLYFSCRKSSLMLVVFLTTMKSTLSSQASEKQKAAMRYSSPLLKDSQTNALQMLSSIPEAAKAKTRKLHMGIDQMAYSATSASSIRSEDTMMSSWQMGKNWLSWPRGSVQKVARAKAKVDSEKDTRCSIDRRSLWFFLCLISIIITHALELNQLTQQHIWAHSAHTYSQSPITCSLAKNAGCFDMTVLNVCIYLPRQVNLGNWIIIAMSKYYWMPESKLRRSFINPESISTHLRCSICQDVFEDPVRTACGHTFCYICIENWAANNKSCPLCKCRFKRKLEKDLIALNIIDDLMAECAHGGCKWTGTYAHVKRHQRQCQFRPKKEANAVGGEVVELEEFQVRAAVVNLEESEGQWQDSRELWGQQ